jgi:hypothetical protein
MAPLPTVGLCKPRGADEQSERICRTFGIWIRKPPVSPLESAAREEDCPVRLRLCLSLPTSCPSLIIGRTAIPARGRGAAVNAVNARVIERRSRAARRTR